MFFSFPLLSVGQKKSPRGKRAFKRDARREKRAQAAAGVRKAGMGRFFFSGETLRGFAMGKKWGIQEYAKLCIWDSIIMYYIIHIIIFIYFIIKSL